MSVPFTINGVINTDEFNTHRLLLEIIEEGTLSDSGYWQDIEETSEGLMLTAVDDDGETDSMKVTPEEIAQAAAHIIQCEGPYYDRRMGRQCEGIPYLTSGIRNAVIKAFLFFPYEKPDPRVCDVLLQLATFGEVLFADEQYEEDEY